MTIDISYKFRFADGREEVFEMAFTKPNMDLIASDKPSTARWTSLEFCQCDHCPLDPQVTSVCPPAHDLQAAVDALGQEYSYTEVTLEVETVERRTVAKTTMSSAFSSLMGLIMATTGCPYTSFFKPMARFHLPLASESETAYRAISTYLLKEMIEKGQCTDFKGLELIYKNMEKVNLAFAQRLQQSGKLKEINSLVKLDVHAKNMSIFLQESLEELTPLFKEPSS